MLTRFSFDLAWWSSFWPQVTRFKLDLEIIKTNNLNKIHDDCLKNVPAWVLTRFSVDLARWPVFDPTWSSFELDLEIIKTNILSNIHDDCLKNVTARVLTRASVQSVTNTPSWRHFLIIKYFKVNDNDIRQDTVYNVSLWVTLIYHPKYNFPGVNSLQDMKQICWAIKYRSLTYTYLRN